MEELQQERRKAGAPAVKVTENSKLAASLDLARRDLERRLQACTHPGRRAQLAAAVADLDRRISSLN
jgi:hypothetical protein